MFHTGTTRLIEAWGELNAGRAPLRADFDPAAVADLLPSMFLLGREGERLAFRIAGEALSDLFGRRLKGSDAFGLFTPPAQPLVRRAALDAVRDGAPIVLIATGRTDMGEQLPLEVLFAPLIGDDGVADRIVGLIQPTATLALLDGRPVAEIAVRMSAAAGPRRRRPALRLAAVDGQRIA